MQILEWCDTVKGGQSIAEEMQERMPTGFQPATKLRITAGRYSKCKLKVFAPRHPWLGSEIMSSVFYKYKCEKWGLMLLDEQRIKISPPVTLNDGFELMPYVDVTEADIVKDITSGAGRLPFVKQIFESHKVVLDTPAKLEKFIADNYSSLVTSFEEIMRGLLDTTLSYSKRMSKQTAVYSVSTDPLNPLMWSHYSDGYKGLCIGIDFSDKADDRIYEVSYSDTRPAVTMEVVRSKEKLTEYILTLVTTKSTDWKYEKEFRLLFNITEEKFQNQPILTGIKPNMIKEVHFSRKTPKETIEELEKIINRKELRHVKCFFVDYEIEEANYKLVRHPFKGGRILEQYLEKRFEE